MDSILGRTILGYRVVEKIGSGGFGNVYRVERNNIVGNTTRALKVITLPGENGRRQGEDEFLFQKGIGSCS